MKDVHELVTATVVDDEQLLTLADLCRACGVHAEVIADMVTTALSNPVASRPGAGNLAGVAFGASPLWYDCSAILR